MKFSPIHQSIARFISVVSTPPLVITLFLIYLMFHFPENLERAIECLVIGFTLLALAPSLYVLYLAKAGRIHGFHMFRREERIAPMLMAFFSTLLALIILWYMGAAKPVIVFLVAGLVNILAFTLVTFFWKISVHTGTLAAILTTVLIYSFGRFLWLWLLLIPVIYARIVRYSHTWGQVIAGILLGIFLTAFILYLFGYWFM